MVIVFNRWDTLEYRGNAPGARERENLVSLMIVRPSRRGNDLGEDVLKRDGGVQTS